MKNKIQSSQTTTWLTSRPLTPQPGALNLGSGSGSTGTLGGRPETGQPTSWWGYSPKTIKMYQCTKGKIYKWLTTNLFVY